MDVAGLDGGLAAAARATLPPSGFTVRRPGILPLSIWMTAEALALSSISLAMHIGQFAARQCRIK
ncbi:MAG: hypothetical protein ABSG65_04830 [Bryobacteraceae bacterium]